MLTVWRIIWVKLTQGIRKGICGWNKIRSMWSNIFLEASTQQNFNFGFSTHKSDVLIHLSQWQYWWWFWFSLVWVSYYFVIVFDTSKQVMTFNPTLNTSLRSHGKWGDFLVALIPLSWCGNILVNSNFILRIIEWQNESSLFTLRIQGKQWYWVYKYDGNAAVMIDAAPKNIGRDRWFLTFSGESYAADSYYQGLHLAAQLESQDMYSVELSKASLNKKSLDSAILYTNYIHTPITRTQNEVTYNPNILIDIAKREDMFRSDDFMGYLTRFFFKKNSTTLLSPNLNRGIPSGSVIWVNFLSVILFIRTNEDTTYLHPYSLAPKTKLCGINYKHGKGSYLNNKFSYFDLLQDNETTLKHYDLLRLDDTQNTFGNLRLTSNNNPVLLHSGILNEHVLSLLQDKSDLNTPLLFTLGIYNDLVETKVTPTEDLWGFRQKKYKRLKDFNFSESISYSSETFQPISKSNIKVHNVLTKNQSDTRLKNAVSAQEYTGRLSYRPTNKHPYTPTTLIAQQARLNDASNAFYLYSSMKLNKRRTELLSVNLARRLLRTKRTLVLPAHVNITVITNSYDVVHSWFIPGLGLKLDCVPGRSTHHTLYVDNVGFYYGQCAEICGRYHHHMPIRVCAIPFEQFLVWWHVKGLPRTLRLHNNKLLLSKMGAKANSHKMFIQYRYNF